MKQQQHIILKAFASQDRLNSRVNQDWKDANYRWYRAIWTEVAETMMHTNWTWWKTNGPKLDAPPTDAQRAEVHIELCDIFHFGLSLDIIKEHNGGVPLEERAIEYVLAFEDAVHGTSDLDNALEALVIDAILVREFNIKKFARACRATGLSFTGLMAYYYAKTALNEFRQENGYSLPKTDPEAYVKMWRMPGSEPKEDNTYLIEIMEAFVGSVGKDELLIEIETGVYGRRIRGVLADYYERRLP